MALVPGDFVVPRPLTTEEFRLEPLGPRHNEVDHAAWTTSIAHIRATPGFACREWPGEAVTADENEADLRRHELDFEERTGFAYAVLAVSSGEYIGCVYFYPPRSAEFDVDVRSWVRHDLAHLDRPLHDAVRRWLADNWPWQAPDYAERSAECGSDRIGVPTCCRSARRPADAVPGTPTPHPPAP